MIDLHTHTMSSDGDKTPQELIDCAIMEGIKAIAITDHDCIDSIEETLQYVAGKNIIFIPGIEFEAKFDNGQMHILGLFIDYKNQSLNDVLKEIKDGREKRNQKFVEEFNKLGFKITIHDLEKVSNGKIIGKPHFAKVFLNKGYIKEKKEIFDNYFNKSPLKEIKKKLYDPEKIIKLIKDSGGIAILAHPQSLKLDNEQLCNKIKELIIYGLDGIECYHSEQSNEQMEEYTKIAKEYNLLITKGTDYHGPITKPSISLGRGINNNILNRGDEEKIINDLLNCYNIFNKKKGK